MHSVAIMEQGARVGVESELLVVSLQQEVIRRLRLGEVKELVLFGQVELTTAALTALVRRGVDVIYLTLQGSFRARVVGPRSPQAMLRFRQLQRCNEDSFAALTASAMVKGKIQHQRQVLLRAQRRLQDEALAEDLGRLRLLMDECDRVPAVERLRGLEGQAAALYFGQFGKLIRVEEFTFSTRSRRPPKDPVNACLSFGYTLLGNVVETEVMRCGLDPMLGFLHQPLHNRRSLALDLLEEFRPFVDTLVLRLVNRRQLGPGDFEKQRVDVEATLAEASGDVATETTEENSKEEGIYLNMTGRKIFLKEYYGRLRETVYYPPRQGAYELRDIIREQGYHLVRVIMGEEEAYRAFVPA